MARNASRMTGEQFKRALKRLGWTQGQTAKKWDLAIRTVNGWATGSPIPKVVQLYIKSLLKSAARSS